MAQSSRGERIESAYEGNLLELLDQLIPDEIDDHQLFFARRMQNGNPSSDHDIAMINLLHQVRELANISEDTVLAQRLADEEMGSTTEESESSSDSEEVVIDPEENVHGQRVSRSVRTRIAHLLPRSWVTPMRDWLSVSKVVLARRLRAAVPSIRITRRTGSPTGHDCIICRDPIHGAWIRAPCGHYYDISCASNLFQSASRDETLFPPRCCGQNIPLSRARPHLPRTLVTTFRQKRTEFSTLKRVYCSAPKCSRFLGPVSERTFGGRVYTCPAPGCRRRTCAKCREEHNGDRTHVCRPDAGATQVLELSRASGWARCPGCSHMIELHLGCFHTTCRCGTEFCYLCRATWKTCDCPQWDEDRLVDAGDQNEGE